MRRLVKILTFLAALAAPCGMAQAQTLTAAKIDSINKAADSFVALAKGSENTGKPPRYSDATAKPLLDAVLNTKDIEGGKPLPWPSITLLNDWNRAVTKVGLVYYLAGTGTADPRVASKDPQTVIKANRNTVAFAPEFGRFYDAQVRIALAMIDAATAQLAVVTDDQRKDPAFKATLNGISDNAAKAMTGLLGSFVHEGTSDEWLLSRVVVLLDMTFKTAKFMAPEDRQQVRDAAVEVAGQMNNPDVKSGVNTVARALEML
jgi:hypothetical protein